MRRCCKAFVSNANAYDIDLPVDKVPNARARYMEVHNGRLLSQPRVILRRPRLFPVVCSNRSEDLFVRAIMQGGAADASRALR